MKAIRIDHPFQRSEVLAIPDIKVLRCSHDRNASGNLRHDHGCYGVVLCEDADEAAVQTAIDGIATIVLQGPIPSGPDQETALTEMEKL